MFKKTMKFDDLDGNEVEQTFYFNYNKKEIGELLEFGQLSQFPSDKKRLPLEQQLTLLKTPVSESGLTQAENNQQAYDIFQDLILDAYGEKGADNVTFVKNERTRAYFQSHVAFVDLIFEFLENPRLGGQFIENCLPAKLVAKAKEDLASESKGQIEGKTLSEMVEEAERRQQDPATRVEPGTMPKDADPSVRGLAEATADAEKKGRDVETIHGGVDKIDDGSVPEKRPEDLTADDIREMDYVSFTKIDPQRLSREAMVAAFQRKSK